MTDAESQPPPPPPSATYGWIGIGNMGYGMAMNLAVKIPADAHLIIHDINAGQVTKFLSEIQTRGLVAANKVSAADHPAEIATKASIILTSLPHGDAVVDVYTNPSTGLVAGLTSITTSTARSTSTPTTTAKEDHDNDESPPSTSPKLFIETSTIPISASTISREAITALGHQFIDAPVSGGIPAAAAGTLTVMAGGTPSVFNAALPILATYASTRSKIFHCGSGSDDDDDDGQPGAGLATKQINNYVAMCAFIGLCEGMNTGIRYGLNPQLLGAIINASSGMSWNSLHMNPVKDVVEGSSSNGGFQPGFPTELARGVMAQARELMHSVGARSILAAKVEGLFERAVMDPRCRGWECRSVWRLWEGEGEGLSGLED